MCKKLKRPQQRHHSAAAAVVCAASQLDQSLSPSFWSVHKLRWQVFVFFDNLPPYVDISYVINVEKKSTFLDLLLVNVVCEWPIRSAHSHKFITISFNHKPIVSVKLSKPQWNKLCQKNIYSMLQESRPTHFSRS